MQYTEQLVTKVHKGYPKREWQKIRDRNEALDCRIYARSASIAIGIDRWQPSKWDSLMGYKTPGQPIEKKQLQQLPSGQTKQTRLRIMRSRFMG